VQVIEFAAPPASNRWCAAVGGALANGSAVDSRSLIIVI